MYGYGLIGNCQVAALVSKDGAIAWSCMPRPDSPPIFGALLDPEGGECSIALSGYQRSAQHYLENTNVLVTLLESEKSSVKITDFCPRFEQHGRMYRPAQIVRIIEPLQGSPTISIKVSVVDGWSKRPVRAERGNSHLRFPLEEGLLRVATNVPLTYLEQQVSVPLRSPMYLIISWDLPIEDDLEKVARDFLAQTTRHWKQWTATCDIPTKYQKETIRSALALKLHLYEDTGAVLAAITTSLPEEFGGERNWDYRFCWLRDAFFVVSALYRLGRFDEVERFIGYLLDLLHELEEVKPVYTLDRQLPLPEKTYANWKGYNDSLPVRSNNQAGEHIQNDRFGECILTIVPIFLDERLRDLRTPSLESLLLKLVRLATSSIGSKDAGLWELRNTLREHSFTNLMSWAGLSRVRRLCESGLVSRCPVEDVVGAELRAYDAVQRASRDGVIYSSPDPGTGLDASLLMAPILAYPDRVASLQTVCAIRDALAIDQSTKAFLMRYASTDDFGVPKSAFTVCTFWLAHAFARLGDRQSAEQVFEAGLTAANHLQLYSEHFDPDRRIQLGNFPQAYSHVGQILAAFAVSPSWEDWL